MPEGRDDERCPRCGAALWFWTSPTSLAELTTYDGGEK